MTRRAKTKRQIYARIYVFSVEDRHHEIEAQDARDLVEKMTKLVPGTHTKQMAQLAWISGEQADLTVGRYRLVCVGQIVFELWGKLPKPGKEKAKKGSQTEATPRPAEEGKSEEAGVSGEVPLL